MYAAGFFFRHVFSVFSSRTPKRFSVRVLVSQRPKRRGSSPRPRRPCVFQRRILARAPPPPGDGLRRHGHCRRRRRRGRRRRRSRSRRSPVTQVRTQPYSGNVYYHHRCRCVSRRFEYARRDRPFTFLGTRLVAPPWYDVARGAPDRFALVVLPAVPCVIQSTQHTHEQHTCYTLRRRRRWWSSIGRPSTTTPTPP